MNPWTLQLSLAQFLKLPHPLSIFYPTSASYFFPFPPIIYGEAWCRWLQACLESGLCW